MLKPSLKGLIVVALAVFVSACGFHLRGNIPLSEGVKNMYLAAPEGTFKDELETILTRAGANLAANRGAADVILNVTKVDTDRTVGTLDDRGKANSYNLRLIVSYVLQDPQGKAIRKKESLVESRRYNFDPTLVVETEAEEAELVGSMEEDISLRIVRKLASITDYQP